MVTRHVQFCAAVLLLLLLGPAAAFGVAMAPHRAGFAPRPLARAPAVRAIAPLRGEGLRVRHMLVANDGLRSLVAAARASRTDAARREGVAVRDVLVATEGLRSLVAAARRGGPRRIA
eukprot:1049258-Prymnesium_polylepis.2